MAGAEAMKFVRARPGLVRLYQGDFAVEVRLLFGVEL